MRGLMLGLFPDDEGRDPLRFLGATLIHSLSSSSPTTDPPEVEMTECVGEGALEVGVEVDGRELLLLLLLWAFRFVLVWRAVVTAAVALDLDEEELYFSVFFELDAVEIVIGLDISTRWVWEYERGKINKDKSDVDNRYQ